MRFFIQLLVFYIEIDKRLKKRFLFLNFRVQKKEILKNKQLQKFLRMQTNLLHVMIMDALLKFKWNGLLKFLTRFSGMLLSSWQKRKDKNINLLFIYFSFLMCGILALSLACSNTIIVRKIALSSFSSFPSYFMCVKLKEKKFLRMIFLKKKKKEEIYVCIKKTEDKFRRNIPPIFCPSSTIEVHLFT